MTIFIIFEIVTISILALHLDVHIVDFILVLDIEDIWHYII